MGVGDGRVGGETGGADAILMTHIAIRSPPNIKITPRRPSPYLAPSSSCPPGPTPPPPPHVSSLKASNTAGASSARTWWSNARRHPPTVDNCAGSPSRGRGCARQGSCGDTLAPPLLLPPPSSDEAGSPFVPSCPRPSSRRKKPRAPPPTRPPPLARAPRKPFWEFGGVPRICFSFFSRVEGWQRMDVYTIAVGTYLRARSAAGRRPGRGRWPPPPAGARPWRQSLENDVGIMGYRGM